MILGRGLVGHGSRWDMIIGGGLMEVLTRGSVRPIHHAGAGKAGKAGKGADSCLHCANLINHPQ